MNRPLTVLQSFPDPRPTTNPYVVMLLEALRESPEVRVETFTWKRALLGRHDVFHAHWPEILVSGGNPVKALVRQVLFLAMIIRFRLAGTAIVRTVHNVERPRGISRRENLLLALFEGQTDGTIRLNPDTVVPEDIPSTTIPHGHYRQWYSDYTKFPAEERRLCYVGLVRRYKNVDGLLKAFSGLVGPYYLTIGGRVTSLETEQIVRELASRDDRVFLDLEHLSESRYCELVTKSQLVVLPYRQMHNSGAVLAALSLDRPVLAPDNAVNAGLAKEVGPGWVHTFTGDLTPAALKSAVESSQGAVRSISPDLTRRDWAPAASSHVRAYSSAVAVRRPGRLAI